MASRGLAETTGEGFRDVPRPRLRAGREAANDAASPASPQCSRTLEALRARIARIEGGSSPRLGPDAARPPKPLGVRQADAALQGGFPAAGLTEIHVSETRESGAGAGFALAIAALFDAGPARPLLWAGPSDVFREGGLPYLPGMAGFGAPQIVLVRTRRLDEAAWAAEEAAHSGALALVVLEARGHPRRLALDGTRRLHCRARQAGLPVILLRQGGEADATAAPLRLRVRPAAASTVPGLSGHPKLLGHPVFEVTIEKARDGRAQSFFLEWSPDERRFRTPPASRSAPLPRPLLPAPFHRQDMAREAGTVVALRA